MILLAAWILILLGVGTGLHILAALRIATPAKAAYSAPTTPTEAHSVLVGCDAAGMFIVGRAVRCE